MKNGFNSVAKYYKGKENFALFSNEDKHRFPWAPYKMLLDLRTMKVILADTNDGSWVAFTMDQAISACNSLE